MTNNIKVTVRTNFGGSASAYAEDLVGAKAQIARLSAEVPSHIEIVGTSMKLTLKGKRAGIELPA